ncbi:hypothetical protein [Streptomyces sp. NPDC096324]|uniref:hypothetical protein n=1 Tax=Streptomyces sp. NPDC096324 TaxID=3366085 RepID=UPI003812A844
MIRYVHHQLRGTSVAACVMVVSAVVAFGVRGIPEHDGKSWWVVGLFVAVGALSGAVSITRLNWVGEVRDFESALPLANPVAALPAQDPLRFRLLDVDYLATMGVVIGVPTLAASLLWHPAAAFYPLVSATEWLMRAARAARWERRHGVLLWRGHVEEQPLGKGQFLYSSQRPTP